MDRNDTFSPALFQLLGGYLNQDWGLEYATAWEAVKAFKDDSTESQVDEIVQYLDSLLADKTSEPNLKGPANLEEPLKDILLSHGLGYSPNAHGYATRTWVQELREHLSRG